jgi:uncharacterized protein with GYD domain
MMYFIIILSNLTDQNEKKIEQTKRGKNYQTTIDVQGRDNFVFLFTQMASINSETK